MRHSTLEKKGVVNLVHWCTCESLCWLTAPASFAPPAHCEGVSFSGLSAGHLMALAQLETRGSRKWSLQGSSQDVFKQFNWSFWSNVVQAPALCPASGLFYGASGRWWCSGGISLGDNERSFHFRRSQQRRRCNWHKLWALQKGSQLDTKEAVGICLCNNTTCTPKWQMAKRRWR